jgi:uncharacterized protein involved in exopolysaccharide biosynthesis
MVSPMAITAITPRDRLQRIVDLGRKALRYWWLIAVLAVAGGALSMSFAAKRPKKFQSWSTIFYQERIQSSLLSPGREEVMQRNIGDKYREILLARPQLAQIIADPKLNPFPNEPDTDAATDALRAAIKLEGRGGNAFRIVYNDGDADRAKAVTEKLTKLLQEKDESLRNQQARETVEFATKQKEEAEAKLTKDVEALTLFLSQHPEFAADSNSAGEGVSIRARQKQDAAPAPTKAMTPEQQRLLTLERQRQRIQNILNAPPGVPPPPVAAPKTPERIAAEVRVGEAQREVANAKKDLDDVLGKYTPKHPTAIKAQERFDQAQQRLREAQAQVPPDVEPTVAPTTAEDRQKLERQRAEIDAQIAKLQNTKPSTPGTPAVPVTADTTTNYIVKLETDHADLRRRVNEQRERVNSLADSVFRAELDARQKLAETGGRLSVVDPAFKPVKPSGPGKKIFLMAGVVLFMMMGLAIAVVLAVIDDRLYRRSDLDHLGVAVLAVIPPAPKPAKDKAKGGKAGRSGKSRSRSKTKQPEQEAAA